MYQIYQVDAFADKAFGGNPAAVCLLNEWIEEDTMQNIASEINLSETAFLVEDDGAYKLRWFTPVKEVRLCGHATLATAHVLFHHLQVEKDQLEFETLSGTLVVQKIDDGQYKMDLPSDNPEVLFFDDAINNIGLEAKSIFEGKDDYLIILKDQEAVEEAEPDLEAIKKLNKRGVIISAKGDETDFVSRCFYPAYGIDEDPVTGSAHTLLTPYWANRLGKIELEAEQLSQRKGKLRCRLNGDMISLFGNAVTVIQGNLCI